MNNFIILFQRILDFLIIRNMNFPCILFFVIVVWQDETVEYFKQIIYDFLFEIFLLEEKTLHVMLLLPLAVQCKKAH